MSISATNVKELREKTGAGMMDCKKALQETSGDMDEAVKWLRTKGLSKAAKKAGRTAAEGLVTTYLHAGGRIGVLLEVNSETDFVARNDKFQDFCKDIAMHIAALGPQYVKIDEIPPAAVEAEKEVLKAKAIAEGKKPEFLDKILDGQIKKWAAEICLLDQKFVKNPDKTVSEYLTEMIAAIGENLVIRRFARYELGEGIEKKKEDFAAEVAAQLNN
ncbi:MAG: translation elongation factor Ts [Bdellovibrionaceae bacterium]|nr:translation elongation factor Ts [Pseudobdellovibrionaceae bacterium]|tara:strand:+ start:850 stop:1500 length:651 start_codon:yes stop_codon:yes gene_type:complete